MNRTLGIAAYQGSDTILVLLIFGLLTKNILPVVHIEAAQTLLMAQIVSTIVIDFGTTINGTRLLSQSSSLYDRKCLTFSIYLLRSIVAALIVILLMISGYFKNSSIVSEMFLPQFFLYIFSGIINPYWIYSANQTEARLAPVVAVTCTLAIAAALLFGSSLTAERSLWIVSLSFFANSIICAFMIKSKQNSFMAKPVYLLRLFRDGLYFTVSMGAVRFSTYYIFLIISSNTERSTGLLFFFLIRCRDVTQAASGILFRRAYSKLSQALSISVRNYLAMFDENRKQVLIASVLGAFFLAIFGTLYSQIILGRATEAHWVVIGSIALSSLLSGYSIVYGGFGLLVMGKVGIYSIGHITSCILTIGGLYLIPTSINVTATPMWLIAMEAIALMWFVSSFNFIIRGHDRLESNTK